MRREKVGMLFNFTSYSFSYTTSYPSPVNHLHFPRHGFLVFQPASPPSSRSPPRQLGSQPPGLGFLCSPLYSAWGSARPPPLRAPHPSPQDGSQARGVGVCRKEGRGQTVRVATGEGPQEVARAARAGARGTVHLFQSGGLDTEANPPLGRPIPSPARESPEEAAASPLRLPR